MKLQHGMLLALFMTSVSCDRAPQGQPVTKTEGGAVDWVDPKTIQPGPIQRDTLSDEQMTRDAAVLEVVLIDLLTQADSPVELKKESDKQIHFSREALSFKIMTEEVLLFRDEKELEKLPPDQLSKVREAAEHLTQRVSKKDLFKEFAPTDKRIIMYSDDAAAKKKAGSRLGGTQVFSAYSPGYSKDHNLAVVRLAFTWSGGFHGADGTYVMQKQKDGWKVLIKNLVFYV